MAEVAPEVHHSLLSVLVRGAEKTFSNAESLFFEAGLLAKAGATARALCLHQISLEECSKIENMGAWALSLLTGENVSSKRFWPPLEITHQKTKVNNLLGGLPRGPALVECSSQTLLPYA